MSTGFKELVTNLREGNAIDVVRLDNSFIHGTEEDDDHSASAFFYYYVGSLTELIRNKSSVKSLYLESNFFNCLSEGMIDALVEAIGSLPNLIELRMYWDETDIGETKDLLSLLRKLLRNSQSRIRSFHIYMYGNRTPVSAASDYEHFFEFIRGCSSLEAFSIDGIDIISSHHFCALIKKLSQLPKLGAVTIDNARYNLVDQDTQSIANAVTTLSFFELLTLDGNEFNDTVGVAIADTLIANKSNLKELSLVRNLFGDSTAFRIGEALKRNSTLTHLDLGGNRFTGAGIISIAESLHFNTSLKLLDFYGSATFGDKECKAISEMLQKNTSLEKLDVVGCSINDKGYIAIIDALKTNKHLVDLCIFKEEEEIIRSNVGDAMIDALEKNCVIKNIGMERWKGIDKINWEDTSKKRKAIFLTNLNRSNRKALLGNDHQATKNQYVNSMIDFVKNGKMESESFDSDFELSSLYHWIKTKPWLLFNPDCNNSRSNRKRKKMDSINE